MPGLNNSPIGTRVSASGMLSVNPVYLASLHSPLPLEGECSHCRACAETRLVARARVPARAARFTVLELVRNSGNRSFRFVMTQL